MYCHYDQNWKGVDTKWKKTKITVSIAINTLQNMLFYISIYCQSTASVNWQYSLLHYKIVCDCDNKDCYFYYRVCDTDYFNAVAIMHINLNCWSSGAFGGGICNNHYCHNRQAAFHKAASMKGGNIAYEQISQTLLLINPIQTGQFITGFIVCIQIVVNLQ